MKSFTFLASLLFLNIAHFQLHAQDDLLSDLRRDQNVDPGYVPSIFKSTRILNSHSVETLHNGNLDFRISHRFGKLNSGAYNFFGLDEATIRLGLEYGLTDRITVGIGRSSYQKTFDGYFKTKLLRQRNSKEGAFPFSMTWFSNMAINTLRTDDALLNANKSYEYSYAHQLIIARRFSRFFSFQVAPILIHTNLAETNQSNDAFAIGGGGGFTVSKRISFNIDYVYRLPDNQYKPYTNSLSLGVDIETGGHVFQLIVTNSQGIIEQVFVPKTEGLWSKGDLFYGFNISRQFNLKKNKKI